jgi:HEAT repeat protein
MKEVPAPKPPPPVPAPVETPLDPALRESARAELRAAFDSNDPHIRANAVEAAQNTVGVEARDMVEQALSDQAPVVRFAAAMTAGTLRLRDLHEKLWTMRNDPNTRVRIGVRYALHKLGDMRLTHDLEQTAVDPKPRVRETTAFVLGRLGEKSAIKILQRLSSDLDGGVRVAAAEAMWRLGDERGLDVLVAGVVGQYVDDTMICLRGLVGPKDRRVQEYVRGKLTDDYLSVRLQAALALGELGYDDGYTVAMQAITNPDPRERHLAALALGAIGRSDSQPALAPLLKDSEPGVRLAAATALLQLKPGVSAGPAAMR